VVFLHRVEPLSIFQSLLENIILKLPKEMQKVGEEDADA
jgi:hypothetical protein